MQSWIFKSKNGWLKCKRAWQVKTLQCIRAHLIYLCCNILLYNEWFGGIHHNHAEYPFQEYDSNNKPTHFWDSTIRNCKGSYEQQKEGLKTLPIKMQILHMFSSSIFILTSASRLLFFFDWSTCCPLTTGHFKWAF